MTQYWLMKSEPETFSIDDLKAKGRESWDGVRNYQARNFMRDQMKRGDLVLFYHSNAKPPGVVGIARVCEEAHPDHTQWDPNSPYYDPKATQHNPIWHMVAIEFVEKLPRLIALSELRQTPGLEELTLLRPGSRLSIHPVTKNQFDIIHRLGRSKPS